MMLASLLMVASTGFVDFEPGELAVDDTGRAFVTSSGSRLISINASLAKSSPAIHWKTQTSGPVAWSRQSGLLFATMKEINGWTSYDQFKTLIRFRNDEWIREMVQVPSGVAVLVCERNSHKSLVYQIGSDKKPKVIATVDYSIDRLAPSLDGDGLTAVKFKPYVPRKGNVGKCAAVLFEPKPREVELPSECQEWPSFELARLSKDLLAIQCRLQWKPVLMLLDINSRKIVDRMNFDLRANGEFSARKAGNGRYWVVQTSSEGLVVWQISGRKISQHFSATEPKGKTLEDAAHNSKVEWVSSNEFMQTSYKGIRKVNIETKTAQAWVPWHLLDLYK